MDRCNDCGGPEGAIDAVLTGEQWAMLGNPGVLCANCIVRRASLLPHVIKLQCRIVFASDYDDDGSSAPQRPFEGSKNAR